MSRQIEQALLSLMPAQAELPPQLVQLAESLLAQSRHKASTLKADEDVARLYACAHLACDRLKISLDLPPITPRPPIPPRNYKRLYEYLEKTLQASASTPKRTNSTGKGTPSSRNQDAIAAGLSDRPLPSRGTPSKESSLARFRTPSKNELDTSAKSAGRRSTRNVVAELASWVRPVTKFICAETENVQLAGTIIAGMEAVLLPAGQRATEEWVHEETTALLAAIYFYVTMRVSAIRSGLEIGPEAYVPLRKNTLALLSRARTEVTVKAEGEDTAWAGWSNIRAKDFDNAVAKVTESQWLDSDWYRGITDIVQTANGTDAQALDEDDDAGFTQSGQVRRADTMFQDKFDYLSDTRRAEYKVWKTDMLNRISQASETHNAMEVDPA